MSRLSIETPGKAETVIAGLYRDIERRISASPPGLCPVDMSLSFLRLCHAQTCGKCVPCRIGLGQLTTLLEQVLDSTATPETIDLIEKTARVIQDTADCAIGYEAARMVLQGVQGFRDDYLSHVESGRCLFGWDHPVPCVALCPAGVDIPGYIALVRAGRYNDAVRLIRKDNPFPTVCGYVCEHPCEAHCRRSMVDDAVNICGIKRFACDHADNTTLSAVQLLRDIGEGRVPDFKGKRVCVIGGGNVSMDATRTAIRLGASAVTCVYRRRVTDMTALAEEIEEAQSEGCQILSLQAPDHIETDETGRVTALWTRPQVIGAYGKDGRPRPYDADQPLLRTPCDVVIVAIGQSIDAKPFEQVAPVVRGKIQAESDAFVPNTPHVFAGGDAVTGPATVIRAVAAGKVAAANIDAHLGFRHVIKSDVEIPAPHLTNMPACGRIELRSRPAEECVGNFDLVKCGMTEQEVHQETSRCLRCDHFGYGIFKGGRSSKW